MREKENSNSLRRGKPIEHSETRLQEKERTATTHNTNTAGAQNHRGRRHTRHMPLPTSPLSQLNTEVNTLTHVKGGPYFQLTKQETRNREGAELRPSQNCNHTTLTETTQQESRGTLTQQLHPPTTQQTMYHTPTQDSKRKYP